MQNDEYWNYKKTEAKTRKLQKIDKISAVRICVNHTWLCAASLPRAWQNVSTGSGQWRHCGWRWWQVSVMTLWRKWRPWRRSCATVAPEHLVQLRGHSREPRHLQRHSNVIIKNIITVINITISNGNIQSQYVIIQMSAKHLWSYDRVALRILLLFLYKALV